VIFSLVVTAAVVAALLSTRWRIEAVTFTALMAMVMGGVLPPERAFGGFSNPAVIAVAALFVVTAGLRRAGALTAVSNHLLSRPFPGLLLPAGFFSAFINNAPIVSMLVPGVVSWCRRNQVPPSRWLMPLSYVVMLGGMCTLLGTSTNLVVSGLLQQHGLAPMGLFELVPLGVPLLLMGALVIARLRLRLLPDRPDPLRETAEHSREFLVEMLIAEDSALHGRTVQQAGLRNLPGLFLLTVEREGRFLGPVDGKLELHRQDRLVFAGVAKTLPDLLGFPGLVRAAGVHYNPGAALYEAVVSPRSPVVGQTIRECGFRGRYDAAVLAVHRAGERLVTKIGDVRLEPGDTLMVEAPATFRRTWANGVDFSLIATSDHAADSALPHLSRRAALISIGVVVLVVLQWLPFLTAVCMGAVLMVGCRVLTSRQAMQALDLSVLITIGSSLGIAQALQASGAAAAAAEVVLGAAELGPRAMLAMVVLLAIGCAAILGNVAAAALLFPVLVSACERAGYAPRGFVMALAVGASASFLSPHVYAPNMMVYGPGGYRFGDFARLGAPLVALVAAWVVIVVPFVWPP
jgi:di/tricarboxylate transporter